MMSGPNLRGSSPRVRGKLVVLLNVPQEHRLIPARAGKTQRRSTPPRASWAHPRACGENGRRGERGLALGGSSPRVRGKLDGVDADLQGGRLIPARAGKTLRARCAAGGPGAHPRACGENLRGPGGRDYPQGSSPRVRGKRGAGLPAPSLDRLIPARAGKTPCGRSRRPAPPAHPRACGENK